MSRNGNRQTNSPAPLYLDQSRQHRFEGLDCPLGSRNDRRLSGRKASRRSGHVGKKIVTKYNIFLRKSHFLVVEGYDQRIHALYFCPQLYKLDSDKKPVALNGEEIGNLLAQSVRDAVVEKQPWYDPSETVPDEPIISDTNTNIANFDTLVVEEATSTVDEPTSQNLAA
jgi:hypothetical protein